jgi:hypothetical protein
MNSPFELARERTNNQDHQPQAAGDDREEEVHEELHERVLSGDYKNRKLMADSIPSMMLSNTYRA